MSEKRIEEIKERIEAFEAVGWTPKRIRFLERENSELHILMKESARQKQVDQQIIAELDILIGELVVALEKIESEVGDRLPSHGDDLESALFIVAIASTARGKVEDYEKGHSQLLKLLADVRWLQKISSGAAKDIIGRKDSITRNEIGSFSKRFVANFIARVRQDMGIPRIRRGKALLNYRNYKRRIKGPIAASEEEKPWNRDGYMGNLVPKEPASPQTEEERDE